MIFARLISAALALSAAGCTSLIGDVQARLSEPALAGMRWGLLVTTVDGRMIVAIRPDERFVPASNTKLFTTAAAFERLQGLNMPDPSAGLSLRIEPHEGGGTPDLALIGGGDAAVIDADDCKADCLSSLADMAVVNGVRRIDDVIGDDRLFPDQRWAPGWAHEDTLFRAGAPVSALVVNSNEMVLKVEPGMVGDPARLSWRKGDDFFALINETATVEGEKDALQVERLPGSQIVRVFGTLGASVEPHTIPMAVEDPALSAAWRFKRLLEQRGVIIEGDIRARHRFMSLADIPPGRGDGRPIIAWSGAEIARLLPPPLIEDIIFTAKQSQNLHAEVLLRRLGSIKGAGSAEEGLAVVKAMLAEADADPATFDFFDGSGLSSLNRVTPRMVVQFLRWTAGQPWGEAWRAILPVGAIDGTLARRFKGTPLEGHIFAKTGTLAGVNSLSGYMIAASGRMLIVSVFANDRPYEAGSALPAMDAALLSIAEAN
jgi:serine-type D-Ala-D-Ala carboxypeptidase/endopeptidase (penicillin-binding protein 4)